MSLMPALRTPPAVGLATRIAGQLAVMVATVLAVRTPRQIQAVLRRLASGQRPASYQEVEDAWDAVVRVSPRCAGRRGCLVRSLAIVLLCRWRGSWPTWCWGVRTFGLPDAHAWVEAEGRPVAELPGTTAAYCKVLTVGVPTRC
jgi:hypothetical protein